VVLWIVIGAAVLGLLVLALAARPVLARLPELARALRRLADRQARAEELGAQLTELQERVEAVQQRAVVAQERIAVIKAGRGRA
jgi:outer membrane murein-binding lipoprotein Lpp